MAIIHERVICVRTFRPPDNRVAWYTGSGRWSDVYTDRVLRYSEPQYAWMDVSRFADAQTHLVEEIDGEWVRIS